MTPSRPYRPKSELRVIIPWLFLLAGSLVGLLHFWSSTNNDRVQRQVDECIARGGIPVVTSSRIFDEFHGCARGTP